MSTAKITPAQCPQGDDWWVRGGRCGWAHACAGCTGHPDYREDPAMSESIMDTWELVTPGKGGNTDHIRRIGQGLTLCGRVVGSNWQPKVFPPRPRGFTCAHCYRVWESRKEEEG